MNWENILIAALPVVSAILVAVFNNWEKINPSKRRVKELYESLTELKAKYEAEAVKYNEMNNVIETISSAQRTSLQTQILKDCKHIQHAIDQGDVCYEERLKQLIILYREYWLCGYNSQGRLYFNDTIEKAAEHNNPLVHELMSTYFSEYNPDQH